MWNQLSFNARPTASAHIWDVFHALCLGVHRARLWPLLDIRGISSS
jgi:hypothetical protein